MSDIIKSYNEAMERDETEKKQKQVYRWCCFLLLVPPVSIQQYRNTTSHFQLIYRYRGAGYMNEESLFNTQ